MRNFALRIMVLMYFKKSNFLIQDNGTDDLSNL